MRLSDLQPTFVRYEMRHDTWTRVIGDQLTWKDGDPVEQVSGEREFTIMDVPFDRAQGIYLLCPKCFAANGGAVGTHGLRVTFDGCDVPANLGSHSSSGTPSRWSVRGSSFDDLQLSPSILLVDGCGWHGHIGLTTPGEVTSC